MLTTLVRERVKLAAVDPGGVGLMLQSVAIGKDARTLPVPLVMVAFAQTNSQANMVTPQVTPQVEQLLAVIQGEMTRLQLMAALGLKDRKHFASTYLKPTLEAGSIEMTLPDKPNSGLQKYRKTLPQP